MELKGQRTTVRWDGETLTMATKSGFIATTKLNGKKDVSLHRDRISGVELKPPIFGGVGTLKVHTRIGDTYEVDFQKKQRDGFTELADQFETAAPSIQFEGVEITPGHVRYKGFSYDLPATARVETAGQIQERVTATRLVAVGLFAFAFKKKKDDRELYLSVEGDGWGFVVDVDPSKGREAREFAMKINGAK